METSIYHIVINIKAAFLCFRLVVVVVVVVVLLLV
jgi:hypothetical protein